MKYCKKCKHLHNDNEEICSDCKKPLTEITDETTPVFLISASDFELIRIKAALEDSKIPCDSIPQKRMISAKAVIGNDMTVSDILVPYSLYEKAYDVCIGIGAIKNGNEQIIDDDAENDSDYNAETEEFEKMDSKKRMLVRIVSAALLIMIFAFVIYGTDFITGLIKNLF